MVELTERSVRRPSAWSHARWGLVRWRLPTNVRSYQHARAEQGECGRSVARVATQRTGLARGLLDACWKRGSTRARACPSALASERRAVRERWRARLAELQSAARIRPDAPETRKLVRRDRRAGGAVARPGCAYRRGRCATCQFCQPRPLAPERSRRCSTTTRSCWSTHWAKRAATCGWSRRADPRRDAAAARDHRTDRWHRSTRSSRSRHSKQARICATLDQNCAP